MSDLAPRVSVPAIAARIAAKAALSSVPGIGPLLVAVLDEVVPALRANRLQAFAEELDGRVLNLSPDELSDRMRQPDRFNLLEDGLHQAARASSRECVSHIANVVANGLTQEDANAEDRRYLLQLLGELNDVEVLILCGRGRESMTRATEFYEQHKEALDYRRACYGDGPEISDRQSVRENYEAHLVRIGLLEEIFNAPYNKPLEIDRHGKPTGIHRQLSWLGRYLLREIGQPADTDVQPPR